MGQWHKKAKWNFILLLLSLVLLLGMMAAAAIGSASITMTDVLKVTGRSLPVIGEFFDTSGIPSHHGVIVKHVRLPRILLSVLVGISLSVCGATFQGMFQNPMADPFVIGISSGAALGATIAIVGKLDQVFLGMGSISLFAFLGALGSAYLVYHLAKIQSKVPVSTLLLSGIAVGQFLTAIMSFLMVIHSSDVNKIIFWTLGSFATKGWDQVQMMVVPALLGWFLLYYFSRDLNAMLLGEESAHHLGVEVEKTKKTLLLINSSIVAVAVSVSGIIGFVGLMIPHIARLLVGPDHRILIPASGLAGGMFMLFADTVARTVIAPVEIPVGIITALFGGPFFIYLLRKKKSSIL
ncbi:FecCD family ABC transporter permease [Thermotalea metallivorans]|nr:iron chelate uptake ABC transporter family permease subunit [Thermotalea metallivorans]